jgi:hypothetical protein
MTRITTSGQKLSSPVVFVVYLHHCANGNLLQFLTHCVLLAIRLLVSEPLHVIQKHTQTEAKYAECAHLQDSAEHTANEWHLGRHSHDFASGKRHLGLCELQVMPSCRSASEKRRKRQPVCSETSTESRTIQVHI